MRIRLKEGVTGNTGARSARGPDPIAENVNTLVTRLCTITGRARARATRQASKHALASAYTRECVRAEGFVVRADTQSGHLEFTFKRYDRKEGGGGEVREGEKERDAAPCGTGVWQYEEADYPTGPGIPRSRLVTRDSL